eukprot:1159100-Pelagomonas_calceolata.AAC.1
MPPCPLVEFQLGAALASAALIYAYRSTTCDAAVASAVWFARLFVLLMALLVDKVARLFVAVGGTAGGQGSRVVWLLSSDTPENSVINATTLQTDLTQVAITPNLPYS